MKATEKAWTNRSVLEFAAGRDPVQAVVHSAREIVIQAIDNGWKGPPFDPMELAEMRGIPVTPRADIRDARTVPMGRKQLTIEYNPTRPQGRLRYSIAHEIAHTLFPDCGERIRHRAKPEAFESADEWQLEALCNIAAAEFLMPLGSLDPQEIKNLDINAITGVRKKFDVSTEAILIRLANLSERSCAVFVASQWRGGSELTGTYRFDYVIPTRTWPHRVESGMQLPEKSPVSECTAIGYTAKGEAKLQGIAETLHVECMGIPPYPGAAFPRVAGFLSSERTQRSSGIEFLKGNALEPRGAGPKFIVHVVSDATPNWGGRGFAVALKKKWPDAQEQFRNWASSPEKLKLGAVHFGSLEGDIELASIISQHGYGASSTPRIRYAALEEGLEKIAVRAKAKNATLHMPRIGSGQAGGSWMVIEELISSTLLDAGVPVTVYDLPAGRGSVNDQFSLVPSS